MARQTIRVTGIPLDQIAPEIQQALDTALAGTLNLQQGSLAKANPKDTGRMAASWTVGYNQPDLSVKPEGIQPPIPQPYSLPITFKGDWYISNNVPYAQNIALDYSPAAPKAQKDWFTSIANQTGNVFTTQFNKVKP
jgi:hypothetical protein